MQQHPEYLLELVNDRQGRVRAEVALGRQQVSQRGPGAVRRQLGSALIALGQRLAGSPHASRPVTTRLALSPGHR